MNSVTILALSLLAGLAAGGLTWFAWAAAENLLASLRARPKAGKQKQDQQDDQAG